MCDYLDNYKIVTVEDILAGKIKLVDDFKINDHNALIERFKQQNVFNEALPAEQLEERGEVFPANEQLAIPFQNDLHVTTLW